MDYIIGLNSSPLPIYTVFVMWPYSWSYQGTKCIVLPFEVELGHVVGFVQQDVNRHNASRGLKEHLSILTCSPAPLASLWEPCANSLPAVPRRRIKNAWPAKPSLDQLTPKFPSLDSSSINWSTYTQEKIMDVGLSNWVWGIFSHGNSQFTYLSRQMWQPSNFYTCLQCSLPIHLLPKSYFLSKTQTIQWIFYLSWRLITNSWTIWPLLVHLAALIFWHCPSLSLSKFQIH